MIKVAPSLLSADFLELRRSIDLAVKAGADYLHYDVMDGNFVPNISFGQGILKAVAGYGALPVDAHLMVDRPERYIEDFAKAGARIITVHAEATCHLQRALSQIRALGCLAGVSLNPATLAGVPALCAGRLRPGPGDDGEPRVRRAKDAAPAVEKIGEIRRMLESAGVQAMIQVDGGVSLSTAGAMVAQGARRAGGGQRLLRKRRPGGLRPRAQGPGLTRPAPRAARRGPEWVGPNALRPGRPHGPRTGRGGFKGAGV